MNTLLILHISIKVKIGRLQEYNGKNFFLLLSNRRFAFMPHKQRLQWWTAGQAKKDNEAILEIDPAVQL